MLVPDKIYIAIVDDHPVVIEGLKALLKTEDYLHTVSFTTGAGILSHIQENEVNVVLLDIMLPDANGIDICKQLKKIAPQTNIIALSNQAERSIIMQMLQNGASGYVLKNAGAAELLHCIKDALDGNICFSKEVKEIMARPSRYELQSIPALTRREKEIIKLIASGKTTHQIAENLFLSPFTVETHRRNLLQKLRVKNVAELIKIAVDYRLF